MKRHFIFISILLFALKIGLCQTNIYHPFPDSSFWRVDAYASDNFTGCQEDYYYDYYFDGDTIINGSSHKKLFRSPVLILRQGGGPPCYVWPWATFLGYMGALRDDSLSDKSFFVFPDQNNDTLLFDYNLAVDDTIKGFISANCLMKITSIDSVLIDTQYRKKWNFNTCNEGSGYFIQGIGSDNGLIEWLNSSGFNITHLICVKDSSMILFETGFNSAIGCQLVTAVEEILNASLKVEIFPNPFNEQTTLRLDKPLKNAVLEIYNAYGQKVKQIGNLTGQAIIFHRENLISGLYFFRLTDGKETLALDKFLITDH
jgi:hypothetical protein